MAGLKLCILSSEIMPYAKTGGLADVAGALVQELKALGHDVRAFMPLYASVRRAHPELLQPVDAVQAVPLTIGSTEYRFSLQAASFSGTDSSMYFIDCPALFDRPAFYTNDPDEHRRFLLFTRAAMESCRALGFAPDVFHCNDWHTAFLPLYLRTLYASDAFFANSRSVLTIHNIGYQGVMPGVAAPDLGLSAPESLLDSADLANGVINSLKTGAKYADRVTTVSPTYAREICAAPLGMGLQEVLRARGDQVLGILNGVDYREWDPRHDPHLAAHFDPKDLRGKLANKQRLIAVNDLRIDLSRPLVGMVTRLAEQKGIELLFDTLPAALQQRDFGFVVLGSGDTHYQEFFENLERRFPGRAAFRSGYDESMAHLIEAGSDIFLMPSRYEPCGLNQMYSLRYGTIPIVRNTGGLADSVQQFDPRSGIGTGCVFNDFDAPAVRWAINTVLDWFAEPQSWQHLMQNAMAQDFSWSRQVLLYETLYRSLLGA
jgi:starch synthase